MLSLLAVFEEQKFEDGAEDGKMAKLQKDNTISSGREKKKGRYVQLMMENRKVCDSDEKALTFNLQNLFLLSSFTFPSLRKGNSLKSTL